MKTFSEYLTETPELSPDHVEVGAENDKHKFHIHSSSPNKFWVQKAHKVSGKAIGKPTDPVKDINSARRVAKRMAGQTVVFGEDMGGAVPGAPTNSTAGIAPSEKNPPMPKKKQLSYKEKNINDSKSLRKIMGALDV